MMMKKLLLAGACAGLLALSAAPVLAAGPVISSSRAQVADGNAVQNVEYRWNQWQGRRTWQNWQRPHHYSPRYGRGAWGNRHYSPWYGRGSWGNHHRIPPGHWRHHNPPGHWRW